MRRSAVVAAAGLAGSLVVGGAKGVCRVGGAGAGIRAGAAREYPARAPRSPTCSRTGRTGARTGDTRPSGYGGCSTALDGGAAPADGSAGTGAGAGAMPQTSQKPSASMWPAHPGWVHRFIAASPSRSRSP